MKNLAFGICLTLFVLASKSLALETEFSKLKHFITKDMKSANAAGLAIVIIENGRVKHMAGFGEEERGSRRKVTTKTLFKLESFTKSVTALAAIELVRLGKLDLNAPITKYIPEFQLPSPWRADSINVRDVLMMTAGIVGFPSALDLDRLPFDATKPGALQEFIKILSSEPPLIEPGMLFNYSNAGYGLLGLIIERASGSWYSDAIDSLVLTPAKMRNATFQNSIANGKVHAFVHGKTLEGESVSQDPTLAKESYFERPWGGLYGSILDVGRFGEFLFDGRMDQMISDQIEKDLPNYSFGYGLHLQKAAFTGKETDDLVVWAAGNGTGIGASSLGFASSLYFVPNKKFAVGIVSNDGEYSYKKVVSKAFELFLGQDRQSVVISKSPPETWIKYTGVYYSVTYGDMIVSLVGERLWLEVPQLNFQTELIQNRDSTFIWAHLPESVLNQNHLTAAAYDANPIFSSSFLKKPGSTAEKTDFLVSRLVIGVRKQESCSHQIRAF